MHGYRTLIVCALAAVSACSNPTTSTAHSAAAPTRVASETAPSGNAGSVSMVSDALGQRLDQMLSSSRANGAMTR